MSDQPLWVEKIDSYWQCHCNCGWDSKNLPFSDPDAAYHAGHLHNAWSHPERVDWDEELTKFKVYENIKDND